VFTCQDGSLETAILTCLWLFVKSLYANPGPLADLLCSRFALASILRKARRAAGQANRNHDFRIRKATVWFCYTFL